VLLLLPTMVEGGGCAVMVDAGVMVGVVAATMAEGEAALGKKKREKNCHNLCYLKINLNVPQQLFYVYYRKQLHLQ
jgi:hypothetical protein